MLGGGLADRPQVVVVDRIDDGESVGSVQRFAKRDFAAADLCQIDQPNRQSCLLSQHAHQVGIAHRGQRMILHRGFGEEGVADEQVPLEHRAAIGREGGAGEGAGFSDEVEQGLGYGADIAFSGGVEGRAVLEEELPRAGGKQDLGRGAGERYGFIGRDGARLERDDDGIGVRERGAGLRHPHDLPDQHSLTRERQG